MGTIVNDGLEGMARMLNGVSPPSPFRYIANGTDPAAELHDQTALGSENTQYGAQRKEATCAFSAPSTSTWNAIFYFTGDVTVREYGIFSESSSGKMLYRRVLASNRNYVDGDSMEVNISNTYLRGG